MLVRSKRFRILAATLIFVGLALGMNVISLEAGGCEDAYLRCVYDPYILLNGLFGGMYCASGYLFCKKYIE